MTSSLHDRSLLRSRSLMGSELPRPAFGISVTPLAARYDAIVEQVLAADRRGLDLVGIQDHPYQRRFLDTFALIADLLARTERLRVFPDVASLPMRPPAMLAKAAASLDVISGGRFELGLGAGAFWDAVAGMGGPRRSSDERTEALSEAIAIIRAALDAGADAVNDVSAGTDDPAMLALVAERRAGVILMHRLRRPAEDSRSDRYAQAPVYEGGVVAGVRAFLLGRADAAMAAGIDREAIAIDPGLGFGKGGAPATNLALLRHAGDLGRALGRPVVVGPSRKRFLRALLPAHQRADPLALDVAVRDGRIKRGEILLFEAVGGGFTWGSALVKY